MRFRGGGWGDSGDVFYTRLILEDQSNPYGLMDSDFTTAWAPYGEGGHLINIVPFSLNHHNSASEELVPQVYMTGPTLTSYRVADNPTGDYSLYYRIGDEVTYTPPAVDGYVTPTVHSCWQCANGFGVLYPGRTRQRRCWHRYFGRAISSYGS